MENDSSSLLKNARNEEKAHKTFRKLYPQGCEGKQTQVMNVNSVSLPSKISKLSEVKSGAKQMVDDSNSQMNGNTRTVTPGSERNLYMDSLYQEIIHRFDGLRERMEHSGILSIIGSEHLLRRVVRHQDQSGNMLSHVEETSKVSNTGRQKSGDGSPGSCRAKCCLKNKSENLEDISMPMFNDDSSIPLMSTRVNPQNLPNSFGTNICLDDITAPSFAQDSRRRSGSPYTQKVTYGSDMPFEYLDNVTMPSYAVCPDMSSAFQPAYMHGNQCLEDDQCGYYLEDIPMPSYTVVSVSQQQHTMPSECLDNITQPSYGNTMSQAQSQQKPDFSTGSLNIFETSAPFYENSRMMTSEEVCGAPGSGPTMRQQQSMQSQNICDESAPSFGSRFEAVSDPYLQDMSMPSYANVSGASGGQPTMPSDFLNNITQPSYNRRVTYGTYRGQNINDISAPSYGTNGMMTNERLENMTMPSYGGVSCAVSGQQTFLPCGCPEDERAPSYGRSMSLNRTQKCWPLKNASRATNPKAPTRQQTMPSECLNDMSMPSFGGVSGQSGRQHSMSTFGGVSGSSRRQLTIPCECLNDMSMPSFGGVSGQSGRPQTMPTFGGVSGSSRRQQSVPCECLNDMSMPSFGGVSGPSGRQQSMSTFAGVSGSPRRQQPVPSECLNNMSMPSFGGVSGPSGRQQTMSTFGGVSGSSRRQQNMPSECLNDMSMPSFGGVSGPSGRQQSMSTFGGVSGSSRRQQPVPSEYLNNMSIPSFGGVSGPSGRQQTMPSECLNDMSMPSFGGVSRPSGRQQTMPSECLNDMSMPSFGGVSGPSGRQQTMPSECLNDMSMPSFGGVSRPSGRQQTMPSECLNDMSMPSFGGSSGPSGRQQPISTNGAVSRPSGRQQTMPSECLNDMSMPSFGGVSGSSGRQQTMPTFGGVSGSSRRQQTMTCVCLNDMSMPSSGGVSGPSGRQQTVPSECLNDMSMPSFCGSSGPSGRQQAMSTNGAVSGFSRRQQTMPSECLNDMSMPSFGGVSGPSARQQTMPSECLNDMSMPSFGGVSRPSGRQQTMPSECLNNMSMPSFGGVSGPSARQQTMPSECLNDMSMPSFCGSSGPSGRQQPMSTNGAGSGSSRRQQTMPSECLNDMSMPSFGGVSGSSGRQQTMPSFGGVSGSSGRQQTINEFGGVSGSSRRQQTMTCVCLNDMSMPSFRGVSGPSGRQQTVPSECLNEMSMPSFCGSSGPTGRKQNMPSEFINDMSMPSFGGVSGPSGRQQTMPSECLNDMSMPSFGGVSGSSGRQQTMPSECLNDISMPSFGGVSGFSRRQQIMPSECLKNVTQPSSGLITIEDLKNITLPSFGVISSPSRRQESERSMSRSKNQKSMPTQNLNDISMPSFGEVSDASRARPPKKQQSTMQSQNISTISASSSGSHGSRISRGRTRSRRQQTTQSQNITDISAPTFDNSEKGAMTDDQMTMPTTSVVSESFRRMQHARSLSHGANPRRQQNSSGTRRINMACECLANASMAPGIPNYSYDQTMPGQYVDNVSAPTFGNSISQSLSQRQQMSGSGQKISMRRTHFNVDEFRSDVSAANFNSTLASYHQQSMQCPEAMPRSEYQTNDTMPSMQTESSKLHTVHSFPCLSNPQQICDISEPSTQGVNYSYPDSQNTGQYTYAGQINGDSSPANPLPHLLWADETNCSGNIDQVTTPSMFPDSRFQSQFEKSNNNQSTNLQNDGAQLSKLDQVNNSGNGSRPGNKSPGSTSSPKTCAVKKNAKPPNNPKILSSVKGKAMISVSNTSIKKGKGKTNGATAYKKSYQKSNTQNIDDILTPMVESIEQSGASGPSNLNNMFVSDISEPIFGPSLENDTSKPKRDQRSGSRKPSDKKESKSPKKQPR